MKPMQVRGKLVSWKDDRGFGFIKPENGSQDVFLHITALKQGGRRPKIGDSILYRPVTQSDGKSRATQASIQGVVYSVSRSKYPNKNSRLVKIFVSVVAFVAIAIFTLEFGSNDSPPPLTALSKPGCDIKGNISVNTDNKIYHLPGMEDYESTIIDPAKGEKWFCSELDAIESGWKKAPR